MQTDGQTEVWHYKTSMEIQTKVMFKDNIKALAHIRCWLWQLQRTRAILILFLYSKYNAKMHRKGYDIAKVLKAPSVKRSYMLMFTAKMHALSPKMIKYSCNKHRLQTVCWAVQKYVRNIYTWCQWSIKSFNSINQQLKKHLSPQWVVDRSTNQPTVRWVWYTIFGLYLQGHNHDKLYIIYLYVSAKIHRQRAS